jgi:hypothetical protein
MKKGMMFFMFALVLSSLVLSGCLGAPGSDSGSTDGVGILQNVVTLGFLGPEGLGIIDAPIDPIVGFVRFLLFALVLVLLQYGASFLGLPGYLRWIIAAVFALIFAVFTPNALLLAAASGWTTLFGLIIVGAPIAVLIWIYFLVSNDYAKLGLTALLLGVMYSVKTTVATMMNAGMPLETAGLSTWLFGSFETWGWMDYGILVVWIMLAVIIFRIASSFGGSSDHHPNKLKQIFNWGKDKVSSYDKKELRHAGREVTRALNDFVLEQKEYEEMEASKNAAQLYDASVRAGLENYEVLSKNYLDELNDRFDKVKDHFEEKGGVVKTLTKNNVRKRRELKEFKKLVKEMKKRNVPVAEIEKVEDQHDALVSYYLKAQKKVKEAEAMYAPLKKNHKHVTTQCMLAYTTTSVSGGIGPLVKIDAANSGTPSLTDMTVNGGNIMGGVRDAVDHINTNLAGFVAKMDNAMDEEKKAIDAYPVFINLVKSNWA